MLGFVSVVFYRTGWFFLSSAGEKAFSLVYVRKYLRYHHNLAFFFSFSQQRRSCVSGFFFFEKLYQDNVVVGDGKYTLF